MYYVYVLKSRNNCRLYKGFTNNLDRRLSEHQLGKCNSTKNMLPIELIFVQVCETRVKARALEKYFKSGYEREVLREII